MKKIYYLLLLLPLFIASCSDSGSNPWDGKDTIPDGSVIAKKEISFEGLKDGITKVDDKTLAFVLYAPQNSEVFLLGDFNKWEAKEEYKLEKRGDRFMICLTNFDNTKAYACQYLVDDYIRIADPYATTILDRNDRSISNDIYPNLHPYPAGAQNEIAMLVSTKQDEYAWKNVNFKIDNPENMVIYELLIRDFTEQRSIKAAQEKIPYLKELGVSVIELMPINEFEGNRSWGYNPSYFFAADKAYGTQRAYKEFIDECHSNGIAVVIDLVLNHAFDQCALVKLAKDENGRLKAGNPWFNLESPNTDYSWGQDFNHESEATQNFVDSVCAFWLEEYKVDGFRFDFTKGFTNTTGNGWAYDADRIRILKRMYDRIEEVNQDAVVIFEHLTDNNEERELANHGIYLWGNMNYSYNQLTMGYNENDLSRTSYQNRGWDKAHLVSYMESHDEERIMFKNLAYGKEYNGYSCKDLDTALERVGAAAAIYFAIPGPKMIWQFGERGYDVELNSNDGGGRLDIKPAHWEYMDNPNRKKLYDTFAKLIKLKKENPAFQTKNFNLEVGEGYIKKVALHHPEGSVYVVANLDVVPQSVTLTFDKAATWIDMDTEAVLSTSAEATFELNAGEYRIVVERKN